MKKGNKMAEVKVGILMGSFSDVEEMSESWKALDELGIGYEVIVASAHRSPKLVVDFVGKAKARGIKVIIAGAGQSAHLAGVAAAHTTLPVIGVPMSSGNLNGLDALLSTVNMPPGVPVATVGIGRSGARNAGLLAAKMIALSDKRVAKKIEEYQNGLSDKVVSMNKQLKEYLAKNKK